jgi:hypothetical protein
MTPDQLIDLLEKAGMLKEESPGVLGWHPTMQKVERFAALLRAEEREACAMECIKLANKWTRLGAWGENNEVHDCAAAIRARGKV